MKWAAYIYCIFVKNVAELQSVRPQAGAECGRFVCPEFRLPGDFNVLRRLNKSDIDWAFLQEEHFPLYGRSKWENSQIRRSRSVCIYLISLILKAASWIPRMQRGFLKMWRTEAYSDCHRTLGVHEGVSIRPKISPNPNPPLLQPRIWGFLRNLDWESSLPNSFTWVQKPGFSWKSSVGAFCFS